MSKYDPLVAFLKTVPSDTHKFSFEEIEQIIGEKLPPSAYQYDAWWSNNESHSLMNEVLKVGWEKSYIDFVNKQVEFTRTISSRDIIMSFDDLVNYLQKATMFRNYQAVVIKTLVENGGRTSKGSVRKVLEEYNRSNPSQSMFSTVLGVLKDHNVVRAEGDNLILNTNGQLSDGESEKIINLCNQRIKEFENTSSSKDKIAICWPTDNDDEKIDAFIDIVKQNGKALWGVNWNAPRIKKDDFPIKGYLYHRRKIIAIATIHDITDANSTSQYEITLKPENVDYSNNKYSNYLHIYDLKRCDPFPQSILQLMDPDKKMPDVVQQRVYVKELQDVKVNSNVWIWSVTAENWEIVKEKKIWTSKIPENIRTRVRPGDKVIFYVLGTGQFQGIFEFEVDWYDAKEPVWTDETDSVVYPSQIRLRTIQLGHVNVYDIAPRLKLFPNPEDKKIVNLVLKGGAGYPSNNGKPISHEDYLTILNSMSTEMTGPTYVLLRHNANNYGRWQDKLGRMYHYGKIPNYKKITKGTKTIWFDRQNNEFYFWGYGDVSNITQDSTGDFLADVLDFKFFNDSTGKSSNEIIPKKADSSIDEEIKSLPGWNVQNSILEINKEIYDEIVGLGNHLNSFEDTPLRIPSDSELQEGIKKIQEQLLINSNTIREIVLNLASHRHILLAGPIGTGKTQLAKLIPEIIWKDDGYYSEIHTATADWNTQDVIGGIVPRMKNDQVTYDIQYGCVADTILQNWSKDRKNRVSQTRDGRSMRGTWLVIDEFNRADVDKAFGQLFTSLETKMVRIPISNGTGSVELQIPQDYRIIGTLNTADKHYLFKLSDALKRRFAYIEVLPPNRNQKDNEIFYALKNAISEMSNEDFATTIVLDEQTKKIDEEKSNKEIIQNIKTAYDVLDLVRFTKPLGTAILKSIYQTILVGTKLTNDHNDILNSALNTNLVTQLENLTNTSLETILQVLFGNPIEFFENIHNKDQTRERHKDDFNAFLSFIGASNIDDRLQQFVLGKMDTSRWDSIKKSYEETKTRINLPLSLQSFKKSIEDLKKTTLV